MAAEDDVAIGHASVLVCEPSGMKAGEWAILLRVKREAASVLELRLAAGVGMAQPSSATISAAPVQSCIAEGTSASTPVLPYHAAMLGFVQQTFTRAPSVLCLGLGLGELPRAILGLWPKSSVTGIEVCPLVAQLASGLAASTGMAGLQCVEGDAVAEVLSGALQPADVVIVDMGAPDGEALRAPPAACASAPWLARVKALVLEGGMLLVNVLCGCRDGGAQAAIAHLVEAMGGEKWQAGAFVLCGEGEYPPEGNVVLVARRGALQQPVQCTTALGCSVKVVQYT